jgi:hypothetical protein
MLHGFDDEACSLGHKYCRARLDIRKVASVDCGYGQNSIDQLKCFRIERQKPAETLHGRPDRAAADVPSVLKDTAGLVRSVGLDPQRRVMVNDAQFGGSTTRARSVPADGAPQPLARSQRLGERSFETARHRQKMNSATAIMLAISGMTAERTSGAHAANSIASTVPMPSQKRCRRALPQRAVKSVGPSRDSIKAHHLPRCLSAAHVDDTVLAQPREIFGDHKPELVIAFYREGKRHEWRRGGQTNRTNVIWSRFCCLLFQTAGDSRLQKSHCWTLEPVILEFASRFSRSSLKSARRYRLLLAAE